MTKHTKATALLLKIGRITLGLNNPKLDKSPEGRKLKKELEAEKQKLLKEYDAVFDGGDGD